MAIGYKFDHKITIQQPTETQSYGEVSTSYTTFSIVWAGIASLMGTRAGREYYAAKQIIDESMFTFTIRYIADMTTKMRILFNGNYYDIRDINNVDMKNVYLELICRLAQ